MPTPDEIKKIARVYGVFIAKDIPEANCLKNEVINSTENYIIQFLEWLSKDYCIMSKSQIREWYNSAKKTSDYFPNAPKVSPLNKAKSLIEIFERLFGTELFNKRKG